LTSWGGGIGVGSALGGILLILLFSQISR
jgi:hypothetical protein